MTNEELQAKVQEFVNEMALNGVATLVITAGKKGHLVTAVNFRMHRQDAGVITGLLAQVIGDRSETELEAEVRNDASAPFKIDETPLREVINGHD